MKDFSERFDEISLLSIRYVLKELLLVSIPKFIEHLSYIEEELIAEH